MSFFRVLSLTAAAAISLSVTATMGVSGSLTLQPANPQPTGLKPGLSVRYAYPKEVKTLRAAAKALEAGSEAGPPLTGLDYRDTAIGENALTSKRAEQVAADIRGYVKFDAPGTYTIDFLTNDGMRAVIGGQVVGKFDGRQPCDSTFAEEVEVPVAGWYDLQILYFQRLNTSCLHMRMAPKGSRPTWMADSAFGRN
ncbi:PA14 domain-containing protein [Phaeobacter sp.]|uniref:PA14 domain-containing protein n=1 Tax=Phaeobacter sp. TaxID=1902409 RepID=UPI0025EB26EE|nr:PA14 domain-containing protein [Phaeobacter sp.]